MTQKQRLLVLLVALLALCGVCSAGTWWLLRPAETLSAPPRVHLETSANGQTVPVNQPVEVRGGAYSAAPQGQILRLVLWVDGHVAGEAPGPANPLVNAWQWTPTTPGDHTLTLEAIDAAGRRNAAHQIVSVQPAADDPDGDGVPNARDRCPDQPGTPAFGGCPESAPDRDGDSVPDGQDACPDQAGLVAHDGCPQPATGDADGDGLPDDQDACPQAPGPAQGHGCPLPADADGDGVPDWADACPQDFGPNGGCPPAPDADGDGVPDDQDACPDQPGPGEYQGCPVADADGDGVPDDQDACPDQPGPVDSQGCPNAQADDADGDGVPDDQDACPDQPGPADNQGCPLADADGDGIPDDQDACPDQAGVPGNQGCPQPDADGDGVPDDQDACPDQPGPAGNQGCPLTDNDGDGIPNDVDQCPEIAGEPAYDGCPGWLHDLGDWAEAFRPRACEIAPWACHLTTDADGDGVPDGQDACPDQPGPAFYQGCPWQPGVGGALPPEFPCPGLLPAPLCDMVQQDVQRDLWEGWRQGAWQHQPPPEWGFRQAQVAVDPPEAVALKVNEVTTNTAWVRLLCRVRVDDSPWRGPRWESADGMHWTMADPMVWPLEEPRPDGMDLRMVCWGWRRINEGEVFLGRIHVPYSWTGLPSRDMTLTSQEGDAGYNFVVHFTVCEDPDACR